MEVLLPSVLIISVTLLLLVAMYFRLRRRERAKEAIEAGMQRCASLLSVEKGKNRRLEVYFAYDEQGWRIVLGKTQYGAILRSFARVEPFDEAGFCPQLAYTVQRNGKTVIRLPNFWARSVGWCLAGKNDRIIMEAEIVFRDLLMAQSFVRKLSELGLENWDVGLFHNKIVVKWVL